MSAYERELITNDRVYFKTEFLSAHVKSLSFPIPILQTSCIEEVAPERDENGRLYPSRILKCHI